MDAPDTQFVTDEAGHRTGALPSLERYRHLFDALEEVEAYDAAMASGHEAIPFEQAIRGIDEARGEP